MFVDSSEYIINIPQNTEEDIAHFVEKLNNAPRITPPKVQTLYSLIQTLDCIIERFTINDPISPINVGRENSKDFIHPDTNSLSSLSVTNV